MNTEKSRLTTENAQAYKDQFGPVRQTCPPFTKEPVIISCQDEQKAKDSALVVEDENGWTVEFITLPAAPVFYVYRAESLNETTAIQRAFDSWYQNEIDTAGGL